MRAEINIRINPSRICEIFVAGVLLFFACGAPAAVPAQNPGSPNVTPDGVNDISSLTGELRRVSDELEKNASPEKIAALRASLPREWTVATSERKYLISTEYLRNQLSSGSRENAKDWVDNLATELSSYSSDSVANRAPNGTNARAELDRILLGPEFAAAHPPTWWDLFRQRLAVWLARLFARIFDGLARYPIGGRILFWLIVIACAGFIALWIFRFMISRDNMDALPPGRITIASRTWQEWIRAAREAASRKDFREAVHSAYWAAITRLEELGALPKDPTKTPREFLRLVTEPSANELVPRVRYREPLSALTGRLEKIWYANRGADADDFRDALEQLEALGCQLE